VLTLSLTLGVGGSIFAVVHAVLLTPPPFAEPERLVLVGERPIDDTAASPRTVTYATFEAWRARAGPMAELDALDGTNATLTQLGPAERVSITDSTPRLLRLLGVAPALGRSFGPEDVGNPVAVLSHTFWQRKLSADPAVIGRQIVLGGQPHTVVGVLPGRFVFEPDPSDLWRPLAVPPGQADRARVRVVARLAPGATRTSLATALDDVSRASRPPLRVVTLPVTTAISGGAAKPLGLLAGAAALAMLIAFGNLAGLMIVRSIDRRRELAVRSAVGARRSEVARQLLLEAQTLATLGIAGGVLIALWLTPVIGRLALAQFGGLGQREVPVGWETIAVMAVGASACAWVCALIPAFTAAGRSIVDALRRGAASRPSELVVRRVLVAGEVALAFVLLACVTLLGGSLFRLLNTNPGFDARGVMALQVSLPAASYDVDRIVSFYSSLQTALEQRLGARSTAIVNEIPLTGDRGRMLVGTRPGDVEHEAVAREAGPAYFDVMRVPVVTGRSFDPRDDASAPPRVVLSASLAERLFPAERPIGRQIRMAPAAQMAEVIGVVGEVKHRSLDEAVVPTIYLSAMQAPSRSSIVVVRSARPDADVVAAVREEVARLDGALPVYRVRSLQDVVDASPGVPIMRVLTGTFVGFALLALVLGAIGVFGIVAHDVASRRAELALRIALGAAPMRIARATLGRGAVLVGAGLAAGGVLSIWAARALDGLGFATGLTTLSVAVPAAMLIVAGAAAVLPAARRAAGTDPLIALRSE
jgi:predicted permease